MAPSKPPFIAVVSDRSKGLPVGGGGVSVAGSPRPHSFALILTRLCALCQAQFCVLETAVGTGTTPALG